MITHYGLFRPSNPDSPMIKEFEFFRSQGGLTEEWGKSWEAIHGAESTADARAIFAKSKNVKLSPIYGAEQNPVPKKVKMTRWYLEEDPVIRRRVGKTGEECSELLKVCCRITLQGINGINPSSGKSNREELLEEMADVSVQINHTMKALDVTYDESNSWSNRTRLKDSQMDEWEDLEKTGRDWEDRS